jgi:hypothetical protein
MDDAKKATRAIWYAMRRRCTNPDASDFSRYGGRGIRVCERWLGPNGFDNFIADMGIRPLGTGKDKMTIDRIDGDGNYEPGNCRWATYKTQNNDPKRLAKVSAAMRAKWQEPEYRGTIVGFLYGNQHTLGYKHTDEAKAKIAKASRGREQTPEQRAKIGASKVGNKYNVGRTLSAETKAKISAARRAEWANPEIRAMRIAARHG